MKLRKKHVSRVASVILAAVMAVSMVPAAFAAATDLEKPGTIYTPIDSTHHLVQTLYENGEYYEAPADCVFQDGNPCVCGNTKPAATDTSWCKHTKNHWMYEDLHNGTHNVVCTDCGETVSQAVPCVYTDGKCICGHECDHTNNHWNYVDLHNGTHNVVCADCGKVVGEPAACVYTDGKCICGHEKVATDTSWCNHMKNNWIYEDLHNGTHNVVCKDCGETVSEAVPCVYTDGKCICGAEKPACDHMGQHFKFVANNNGTQNVLCADCNAVVSENVPCTYVDGKCIQCGAEKPACDHMKNNWKYVDNGDGTHKVICKDCGKVVEEHAACVYTKGKCVCGGHKKVVIPDTDELDPSFSVSRYPICQFFQAVRQFFRNLFHRV